MKVHSERKSEALYIGGVYMSTDNTRVSVMDSGDAGPFTVSCWPLFEMMSFVGDTVKHKRLAISIFE